ncbi:MAG: hypothetical protein VW397_01060 [Candidatus Margulisiibacteriota bacterium]
MLLFKIVSTLNQGDNIFTHFEYQCRRSRSLIEKLDDLTPFFSQDPNITKLDLSDTNLEPSDIDLILKALLRNPYITDLKMNNCDLDDRLISKIANGIEASNIQSFECMGNKFGVPGKKALLICLKFNEQMTNLRLNKNSHLSINVSDYSSTELNIQIQIQQQINQLGLRQFYRSDAFRLTLDLRMMRFDDLNLACVHTILQHNQSIATIALPHLDKTTYLDDLLDHLANHPSIRHIVLDSKIESVNKPFDQYVKEKCPEKNVFVLNPPIKDLLTLEQVGLELHNSKAFKGELFEPELNDGYDKLSTSKVFKLDINLTQYSQENMVDPLQDISFNINLDEEFGTDENSRQSQLAYYSQDPRLLQFMDQHPIRYEDYRYEAGEPFLNPIDDDIPLQFELNRLIHLFNYGRPFMWPVNLLLQPLLGLSYLYDIDFLIDHIRNHSDTNNDTSNYLDEILTRVHSRYNLSPGLREVNQAYELFSRELSLKYPYLNLSELPVKIILNLDTFNNPGDLDPHFKLVLDLMSTLGFNHFPSLKDFIHRNFSIELLIKLNSIDNPSRTESIFKFILIDTLLSKAEIFVEKKNLIFKLSESIQPENITRKNYYESPNVLLKQMIIDWILNTIGLENHSLIESLFSETFENAEAIIPYLNLSTKELKNDIQKKLLEIISNDLNISSDALSIVFKGDSVIQLFRDNRVDFPKFRPLIIKKLLMTFDFSESDANLLISNINKDGDLKKLLEEPNILARYEIIKQKFINQISNHIKVDINESIFKMVQSHLDLMPLKSLMNLAHQERVMHLILIDIIKDRLSSHDVWSDDLSSFLNSLAESEIITFIINSKGECYLPDDIRNQIRIRLTQDSKLSPDLIGRLLTSDLNSIMILRESSSQLDNRRERQLATYLIDRYEITEDDTMPFITKLKEYPHSYNATHLMMRAPADFEAFDSTIRELMVAFIMTLIKDSQDNLITSELELRCLKLPKLFELFNTQDHLKFIHDSNPTKGHIK